MVNLCSDAIYEFCNCVLGFFICQSVVLNHQISNQSVKGNSDYPFSQYVLVFRAKYLVMLYIAESINLCILLIFISM